MSEQEINSILDQIEEGKNVKRYVYNCCGTSFPSLYEFRQHLFTSHPDELKNIFEIHLHREPSKLTKEEVHKMANKGKKKKEKAIDRKEKRETARKNQDAYPTASKGDFFRLIYTPMGNKK